MQEYLNNLQATLKADTNLGARTSSENIGIYQVILKEDEEIEKVGYILE